jgi:N4-(beta-N-acetylglucosaminyl)-L-asparaginase
MKRRKTSPRPTRRQLVGGAAGAALAAALPGSAHAGPVASGKARPILVGSGNALPGMNLYYERLLSGAHPLDVALEVVKVAEADPADSSVGLGGLPNEDGVVQLDAACMDGETHNSGAVGAIENILHPCEVARLVMERTDHCQIFGEGAYRFARQHGHPHVELLTAKARATWLKWKETMSTEDDRLPPPPPPEDAKGEKHGALPREGDARVADVTVPTRWERHGTIHCSALSQAGHLACTTTTSGLAFKIPGRVGDSPIVGAGLYCDDEAGSAGSTGRGEAAILSTGSAMIVELMRQGAAPLDAGLEVLRRIVRQTGRMARWQPGLVREDGTPAFGVNFYCLSRDGRFAGVTLRGGGKRYAVSDPEQGPRHEPLTPLLP